MVFVAKSLREIFMHLVFEELTHKYNPIPNTFMHQNLVTVFPQHFSIHICFSHVNVKRNITMCTTTRRGAKNNLFTIEIGYTRKCQLRGNILVVLRHTTAWDRYWGGDETLKLVLVYIAWLLLS